MTSTSQIKEEFYLGTASDGDAPDFVDATRYARERVPFPLGAGETLKATCGVWADDEVVAFSMRAYTAGQAEREVEHVEDALGGTVVTRRRILRPRMPHGTLQDISEKARALSPVLGDDMIVVLDGELYVMTPDRRRGRLSLTGRLTGDGDGYARSGIADVDAEFKLPVEGVRLRVFLRSPIRRRIVAYAFGGCLASPSGEAESVLRATALALNGILDLASFRLLSGLDHIEVPPGRAAIRRRERAEPVGFTVPVELFTDDGAPAARGRLAGAIDLERVNPVTGALQVRLSEDEPLEWNPAVAGSVRFDTYRWVLGEAVTRMIHSALGADAVREVSYDIMLGDLGGMAVAGLRAVTADLPRLTATPGHAGPRPNA